MLITLIVGQDLEVGNYKVQSQLIFSDKWGIMSSAFDANNRDVASIFEDSTHESLPGDVRDGNRHDDLYFNHHDEHKCGSWRMISAIPTP